MKKFMINLKDTHSLSANALYVGIIRGDIVVALFHLRSAVVLEKKLKL